MPEARIAIAHGQMNEHALEQVIVDFWEKRFDVLVCTTIVETGLDISNANTLIVERADVLGLSQLHQLRGRVGRGRERAYAYFLYPPEKPLTETAHDRLATIAQNTDLGAGMAVAMKDLEIRGAGNLLGGEQSGHIAGVGFDLYVRLVGEAVAEFKRRGRARRLPRGQGRAAGRRAPAARLRPGRAAAARGLPPARRGRAPTTDVDAVRDELVDRYGAAARRRSSNLLAVARFRVLARARRAHRGHRCRATTSGSRRWSCAEAQQLRLQRLYPGSRRQARGPYGPGAAADDRPDRRPAAARRRAAGLVPRPRRRGAARPARPPRRTAKEPTA